MQSPKHHGSELTTTTVSPLVGPTVSRTQLESWIRSYGSGSSSYVLLEGANGYFNSPHVDGFLAYQISAGIIVVAGDPVCSQQDAPLLVAEFVREMNGRPI